MNFGCLTAMVKLLIFSSFCKNQDCTEETTSNKFFYVKNLKLLNCTEKLKDKYNKISKKKSTVVLINSKTKKKQQKNIILSRKTPKNYQKKLKYQ